MTTWELLVDGEYLNNEAKNRMTQTIKEKVKAVSIENYLKDGWEIVKTYKNGDAMMEKPKRIGDAFEDEVWTIFYKMGFKVMNSSRFFKINYSDSSSKQIDVIAIDDEVCLLVECKATAKIDYSKTWKTDLESINGNFDGLCKEIRKQYPNRKIKYIFATKNYVIGEQDQSRLNDFKIANFDYETILYYSDLVNHLGTAARYQLLGTLFAKQKVPGLDTDIPAIEGKMGNITYYSFSMEPERLLKICYILHRNNANHDMMPTYQRIVKKDRLKSIRNFVNDGGYFPNSIIISIDTNGKGLTFDPSSQRSISRYSRVGVLHLPKTYQSAYVIDGQHRLYGYTDSSYAANNAIPVIAFVDMDKNEQVKMFMDINENQKAVSKSLRNTLYIDLLWESKSLSDRRLALMLSIAQKLGEDKSSPLYGRVVTGENTTTENRCITIDYLKSAFDKSRFFNVYKSKKSNEIKQPGLFDQQDNDKTEQVIYPFIKYCLNTIKAFCQDEWDKGSLGYLTINNCMYAILRIIDDIVGIVVNNENIKFINNSNLNEVENKCEPLLLSLAETLLDLDDVTKQIIKTSKGGQAQATSWRTLQYALHNTNSAFTNDDLEEYIKEHFTNYNDNAILYLGELEDQIRYIIKQQLESKDNWLDNCVPPDLRDSLISKKAIETANRNRKGDNTTVSEWDFISFLEISKIITFGSNWSTMFSSVLIPEGSKENKVNTVSWLKSIYNSKNKLNNGKNVSRTEFLEIEKRYKYFCEQTTEEVD